MKRMGLWMGWLLALVAWASSIAWAAGQPYNDAADVKAEVRHALREADASHKPVLLIFGANWCEDCQALDQALKRAPSAELIAREFLVVKVDVGKFDRNQDVVVTYGNPTKGGIPAAVILSADSRVLYATRAGELADARRMGDDGIYRFFKQAVEQAQGGR